MVFNWPKVLTAQIGNDENLDLGTIHHFYINRATTVCRNFVLFYNKYIKIKNVIALTMVDISTSTPFSKQ